MKTLTKAQAKKLCIKKWNFIVKHDGRYYTQEIEKKFPELANMQNECPYCELYITTDMFSREKDCLGCPINLYKKEGQDILGCNKPKHPFEKWLKSRTKKNAQKVLDLIIKS